MICLILLEDNGFIQYTSFSNLWVRYEIIDGKKSIKFFATFKKNGDVTITNRYNDDVIFITKNDDDKLKGFLLRENRDDKISILLE